MKLQPPQKAQRSKKLRGEAAKTGKKHQRRTAPDYRFRWGDGVWPAVHAMPAPMMKTLHDECCGRMLDAENARKDAMIVLNVFAMEGLSLSEPWWAPFDFGGHTFQLQYKHDKIREYVLEFAPTPLVPPGSPAWEELFKACLALNETARQRGRRKGGAKSALPAAGKRPPKQTEHKRSIVYVLYRLDEMRAAAVKTLNHSCAQLPRAIRPKLLRNLVRMKWARADIVSSARDAVGALVQTSQEFAWLASNVVSSLTRTREGAAETFGPGASLEARWVGHGAGFHLLIYSWILDEQPVGGAEWPVNWFGVLPEEERVFV